MLIPIFLGFVTCSLIAGIFGIVRKQPITASFILGLILGPIGILLVVFYPKPGIIEQRHINLVKIRQDKELQTNEIINDFIEIVRSRIKSIKLYVWLFLIAAIGALISREMLFSNTNIRGSNYELLWLIVAMLCAPLAILSAVLYTQNIDSLVELLWGRKVMWSYRGLSTTPNDNVKAITFFIIPWRVIKIAQEEISKLSS